ncbi:MAG: DUF4184 family protein [Bacteroidota bacterium]
MPFTFSHPAIILPLIAIKRRWRSSTGLVIGSIAPDFEYFMRMEGKSNYSHTLAGAFWFDLPLAIVLSFIFHLVVRNPLFDNLPWFLNKRVIAYKEFNWPEYFSKNFIVICFSILIGTFSHLFWDAFTHDDGFFVQRIAVLTDYWQVAGHEFLVYKMLKIVCSLLGLLVILVVLLRLKKQPLTDNLSNPSYWLLVAALTFTILEIRVYTGFRFYQEFNIVMTFISASLIALILASFIFRKNNFG